MNEIKCRRPRKTYLQAKERLKQMLQSAEYSVGDQIPPERELAQRLSVSRMTLRKIIAEGVSEGLLEKHGNQGTYLAHRAIERPLSQSIKQGISKIVELNGATPSSRLILFHESGASQRIAQRLQIAQGEPTVMIKRLRLADDKPFCLETSFLPRSKVPTLQAEDLSQGESLYHLLNERYQLFGESDEGYISVASMTEDEQQLLEAPPESPALVYRGVIFDSRQQPLEYLVSVNHPHRVSFKINYSMNHSTR
ncbi:GntR family transcriptional regulator [Brenneria rubrifaciens]|uniref:GntR family transcriptional regulator n=1 Tax=Brenneria rubrifaciens TaxID=55213 RepID=A0A4P8QSA3_9GAMM|nr:GntR family transcriptional regulator [Brenneria rubrifaciens]QCR08419.1 GntR family transcriptional regulator [Brenneria rubrifaciens]